MGLAARSQQRPETVLPDTQKLPKQASAQLPYPFSPRPVPLTSSCSRWGTQMPGGHVTGSPSVVSPCPFSTLSIDLRQVCQKCAVWGKRVCPYHLYFGETEVRCVSTLVNEFAWGKNVHQRHVDLTGPSISIPSQELKNISVSGLPSTRRHCPASWAVISDPSFQGAAGRWDQKRNRRKGGGKT